MTRDQFVSQAVAPGQFGLEIGPGYAPTFSKKEGWNVETLDHASTEEIIEKYRSMTDVSRVEHIDYISDGRPIDEIISRRHEYDFVFASHVIEHITDPIAFILACQKLLKPDGNLVLIVPDKRRCFDALQSLTTSGEWLQAHQRKMVRHDAGRVFDFIANTAGMAGSGIWEGHWNGTIALSHSLDQARAAFEEAQADDHYMDIHAWQFTPSSFRLIWRDLVELGYISISEKMAANTNAFEFYFSASLSGAGCPLTRMELHKAMAREQIEGLAQVLA